MDDYIVAVVAVVVDGHDVALLVVHDIEIVTGTVIEMVIGLKRGIDYEMLAGGNDDVVDWDDIAGHD